MTTIFSDGKYLIADHRMSAHLNSNIGACDIVTGNTVLGNYNDGGLKMRFFPEDRIVTANGDRVMAWAVAGLADTSARIIDWVERFTAGRSVELNEYLISRGNLAVTSTCQAVALLANGHTAIINFNDCSIYKTVAPMTIVRGSGYIPYSFLINEYGSFMASLTLEEQFLMCAILDNGSSMSYSVYSLEERIFYPYVLCDQEKITARRKELLTRFANWDKDGKKMAHSPIQYA